MNKHIMFLILSAVCTMMLFTGCYVTSELIPVPSVSVNVPSIEFEPDYDDFDDYDDDYDDDYYDDDFDDFDDDDYYGRPLPAHIQFERTVGGKTWYTRLQDDGNYNRRTQTKMQFNTNSKTFRKEIYCWERVGRGNTFRYVGKKVQQGRYFYTADGNKFDCEVSGRTKGVWCNLDNAEMMTWDGKQYISKQALANQSVTNYTNRKEFTLN